MRTTRRPSPALVISLIALFISLTGTAVALQSNSVKSRHIVDGAVKGVDVADAGLTGTEVSDNSLTGSDITGVTGADVSANSLTGSDIDESTINVGALGCQPGKVQGYARIIGRADMPATFTSSSSFITDTHNCSGDPVFVSLEGTGDYTIRFDGITAELGFTTVADTSSQQCEDNFSSAAPASTGIFQVRSFDDDGDGQHCDVMVAVL